MTDLCKIGPVSIAEAHLFDNNKFSYANSAAITITPSAVMVQKGQYAEGQSFSIIVTNDQFIQLKGIVEKGEVIWMDTSSDLTDNDYLQHKGWVIITSLSMEYLSPKLIECGIEYIKISDHEKEYLTMVYSRGIYDGVNIEPEFEPVTTQTFISEDGSDPTTNWTTIRSGYTKATTDWATTGTALRMRTTALTHLKWGFAWTLIDTQKFYPNFTLETELTCATPAATHNGEVNIGLSPHNYATGTKYFPIKSGKQYLNCIVNSSSTARYVRIESTLSTGKTVALITPVSVGLTGTVKWKIQYYYNNYVRISTNVNGAGYVQRYFGPSNIPDYKNGLYVYMNVNSNNDGTTYQGDMEFLTVTNNSRDAFNNLVPLPIGATLVDSSLTTTTRTGEDGTQTYVVNPNDSLPFKMDSVANLYLGSVKLMSTNNATSTSRQVFSTGVKLTPTTTSLSNGLTKLTFDADEVIVQGYDSGSWRDINRFDMGASIDLIRPLRITENIVVLQINNTKWTMLRGDPVVRVEHPFTDMTYTLRDRYVHDGVTTSSPGAAADITMLDVNVGYHAEIYDNASSTYQLLIVKAGLTTIDSDTLWSDDITGIGWVKSGATGYNTPQMLAKQFYKQTRTGVSLEQIV